MCKTTMSTWVGIEETLLLYSSLMFHILKDSLLPLKVTDD